MSETGRFATGGCAVCGETATDLDSGEPAVLYQDCPRCGKFKIARDIPRIHESVRHKVSGWIRDQNILGEIPEICRGLPLIVPPRLQQRADRLLEYVSKRHSHLGEPFDTKDVALIAVTYSVDLREVDYLLEFLREQGYLRKALTGMAVTPKGYEKVEEQGARQTESAQGVIAMWFDKQMEEALHDGFETGIRDAGYKPVRIDRLELVRKLDDEVIAQIRSARFVVADFTGQRGGVYFEAGFALGLNLPVIWTCRNDHLDKLHFDIRQFAFIDWREPGELALRLRKRIEAVIGVGPIPREIPVASPPAHRQDF